MISLAWNYKILILSLILKLKTLGLTLLVLVLSMMESRLTNGSVAIHLLKLMPYIFLPVIMTNLLSNLLKTLSLIENIKIFPTLTLLVISGIKTIISLTILLLHLSILYFNQMATPLSLLSLKLNSSLKPLLPTLLCMILVIFLLLLHPLTT